MKFAIFLKSSLFFNNSYCLLFLSKTLRLNKFKIRTAMNAEVSVFVICVEVIKTVFWCKRNIIRRFLWKNHNVKSHNKNKKNRSQKSQSHKKLL